MCSRIEENKRLQRIWKEKVIETFGDVEFTVIDQNLWFRMESPYYFNIKGKQIAISFYIEVHVFDYYEQRDIFYNSAQIGFFSECKKEFAETASSNLFSVVVPDGYPISLCLFGETLHWRYKAFNAKTDDSEQFYMIELLSHNAERIIEQFLIVAFSVTYLLLFVKGNY